MKFKWIINFLAVLLLLIIAIFRLVYHVDVMAAQGGTDKIEGVLLDHFAAEGTTDFIMRFTEQADLSPAYSMDWNGRGEFVYNILSDIAARSQANAKAILDANGLTYQTFFAGNDLYVRSGTLAVANELAALPEVYFIRATRTYSIDPFVEVKPLENITWAGDFLANYAMTTVGTTDALDWGITDTGANQFWTTFGVQGDGIVVANIDTGVQWNHPALDQAFKCGTNPSNPACWFDPANICGGSACDNNGHGTHTMGTMVGDDDPGLTYQVGMAPNAKWIACKGCESGSCSDASLNACADWILAPGGNTANRPNVVNNSWGGGSGDPWYQAKVQAWRAAGIFPTFSAGNLGSACNTLGSPGDYQESFSSTAHDASRNIASFSSRGPSTYGHDPYTKPNISAPGVNICSSIPTNAWSCGNSGTSMASPHTAGAVALLWSCNPSLVGQIDQTFQILQNNANVAPAGTCGAPPDGQGNYTYGYGYLNIQAVGAEACAEVVSVKFIIPIIMKLHSIYFDGPWEIEPNNDYTKANGPMMPNRDYYGYPNDDKDYFSFLLFQPGQITIDLTNHVGTDVQLQLFYQNVGNRVGYDPNPPYQIVYNGQPGLYYVFIYTASGFNNTIPYTLRVSFP